MTESNWARPGVKCVCIKKDEWKEFEPADEGYEGHDNHPKFGEVCEVVFVSRRRSGQIGLTLKGYEGNQYRPMWFEPE